jgi:hypothetical protein
VNQDASDCVLAGFGKFLMREGCMGLDPWCFDLHCKSSWILNDFLMKMKLNHSWKFHWNWNVPLVLLERSWWAGFNGIYLVRFGFRLWEILIFKWFLPLKIQLNSKTPGFERKNQLRNVITLEPMAHSTLSQGWITGSCSLHFKIFFMIGLSFFFKKFIKIKK